MEKVYFIKTNLTSEENDRITSEYDDETLKLVKQLSKGIINFDEVGPDGFMTSYVIGDDEHIDFIKTISEKNNITLDIKDITEEFINGDIDVDDREFIEYRKSKIK
jgi:hypothetical protein